MNRLHERGVCFQLSRNLLLSPGPNLFGVDGNTSKMPDKIVTLLYEQSFVLMITTVSVWEQETPYDPTSCAAQCFG